MTIALGLESIVSWGDRESRLNPGFVFPMGTKTIATHGTLFST
jgi:hypothetical protein